MDPKDNVNVSATASVLSIGMRAVDEKATLPSDSETSRDIRQRILEDQAGSSATQRPTTNLSSLWRRQNTSKRPGDIATQPSVFDDPQLAVYFQPSDKYENRHRFDANFRWTWAEEIPLIRKIDWRVTAWSCLAFFALDLDRSNISQANSDNFLEYLGLDTNDYNLGQTVFRVSFLLAELPSQLISKKIGPDRWIPAQMILWSIVSASQFWLNGRSSFLATRAIIGLLQGGFIPDVILMLILTWISERINQRALLGILVELWLLPCVIALAVIPSGVSRWATYALVIVLLSYPSPHPMQVGWASRNSNTVRTRTVSAALYNMSVQLQSIISANIYRRDDRPEYRRGNRALAGIASLNVVIYAAAKVYYVWRNRQRDRIWDAMSPEERQRYLDTTTDKGSKRLDFRFAS
ncbi:putative transporter [Colletotrichum sp. SAR11_239]|nr:putative transporter [Colletotrichum sp. SAR11_239]